MEFLKQTVLRYLKGKATTPILLGQVSYDYSFNRFIVPVEIENKEIKGNIYNLLYFSRKNDTFFVTNRKQCRRGALRSAQDLWRLYKYHFNKDMDLFSIMRAVYELLCTDKLISGHYCSVVRKFVFWTNRMGDGGHFYDYASLGDLGVPFKQWNNFEISQEK